MGKGDYLREADILHPGLAQQIFAHLAIELHQGSVLERLLVHAKFNILDALWIKAGARLVQARQACGEKASANYKHECQSNFAGHHAPGSHPVAFAGLGCVLPLLHVLAETARRCLKRRKESDEKGREDCGQSCKGEDTEVERRIDMLFKLATQQQHREGVADERCNGKARRCAGHRNQ